MNFKSFLQCLCSCTSLFRRVVLMQFLCISCISFYDRRVQPITAQPAWFHRWRFRWEISVLIALASHRWLQETPRASCASVMPGCFPSVCAYGGNYSINVSDLIISAQQRGKDPNPQKTFRNARPSGELLTKNIICIIQSNSDGWNQVWLCYFILWRLNEQSVISSCLCVVSDLSWVCLVALEHYLIVVSVRSVSDMDKYSVFWRLVKTFMELKLILEYMLYCLNQHVVSSYHLGIFFVFLIKFCVSDLLAMRSCETDLGLNQGWFMINVIYLFNHSSIVSTLHC